MDIIRTSFLEQMEKSGRAYPHEIRSIANELIQRRAGVDPFVEKEKKEAKERKKGKGLTIEVDHSLICSPKVIPFNDALHMVSGETWAIQRTGPMRLWVVSRIY